MAGALTLGLVALALTLSAPADVRPRRLAWLAAHRMATPPDQVIAAPAAAMASGGRWSRPRRLRTHPDDGERSLAALHALLAELEAGASQTSAFRSVSAQCGEPIAWSLTWIADALDGGTDPLASVDGTALDSSLADGSLLDSSMRPLAIAASVALRTGCALRDGIDGVVLELESQRALRVAIREAVAGPRAAAVLLALLPALGTGLGIMMGADPIGVLIDRPVGRVALVVGLLFEVSGLLWTNRLVARVIRC